MCERVGEGGGIHVAAWIYKERNGGIEKHDKYI